MTWRKVVEMKSTVALRAVVVAAVVSGPLLAASPAVAAPKCNGKRATIVGTARADFLKGTAKKDVIVGRGGNDFIKGRGARDIVCAGPGDDYVVGAAGKDQVFTGGGKDFVNGGAGLDRIFGGDGDDFVRGRAGNDEIFGGKGVDIVAGDDGNDIVDGGPGDDSVYGGVGHDEVRSGPGNLDLLYGNVGNDTLIGGDGQEYLLGQDGDDVIDGAGGPFDIVSYFFAGNPNGVEVSLATGSATGEGTDTITNVEAVEGSQVGDRLFGSDGANFFYPLGGDDLMDGAMGIDMISFIRSTAAVTVDLGLVVGSATGEGSDTLTSIENVQGSEEGDTITGNLAQNGFLAGGGDDTLNGGLEDDFLDGGTGTDKGDGGLPGLNGDVCVNIEFKTNCPIGPPAPPAPLVAPLEARA